MLVRSEAARRRSSAEALLVDALPKTATEKVAKNVLRDQLAQPDTAIEQMW